MELYCHQERPSEIARSIARISTEELTADMVAGIILSEVGSVVIDGQTRPLRPADVTGFANGYSDQLGLVLSQTVYPGWPNLVQSYRERRIDLNSMWAGIVQGTDQVITLIAHAEAEAILNDGRRPLDEAYAEEPGSALYLTPAWTSIREATGETVFPSKQEYRALQLRISDAGEDALLAMWKKLGLTFEIRPDRGFSIHVTDPLR